MPELPDVEGFRRFFGRRATGKPVRRVWGDRGELRNVGRARLARALTGATFSSPRRRGKWLVCATEGGSSLVLHFGMNGRLSWLAPGQRHRHDRLVLGFAGGDLHFQDMRKLGGVWLLNGADDLSKAAGPLGPDAWRLDRDRFTELLAGRRGGAKAALMDQSFLAGLGNLTVDAALWRARIHPRRELARLDGRERRALFDAIQGVLRDSIPHGLVPPRDDLLTTLRRRGARCPRCRGPMARATVAGRTTWCCPRCQR